MTATTQALETASGRPVKVTAGDIRDALYRRWPPDQYLTLTEAPDGPDRLGRKLDLLAISVWKSRSYQLDGVEIKVSVSDWQRELTQGEKAEWWWAHVHRFWLAVPAAIAAKVAEDLPEGWGLLSVRSDGTTYVAVKAVRHDAVAFSWPQTIGLLRASADAGFNALNRARAEGERDGMERARRDRRGETGAAQAELAELQAVVAAFAEQSGIDLSAGWCGDAKDTAMLGRVVAAATKGYTNPGSAARRLRRLAKDLERSISEINAVADAYLAEMGGTAVAER
jgi:hypothetical protein